MAEVGVIISTRPRTLRRWIKDGVLPAHWVGGRLMVKAEDLAALIERGRVVP
ncbi:helix-turn-helix domain-containing protein [Falsiroseomonas ponticola]|uniref:helix-turn-helix domain-containing protein n=1 Tax=Falsiroseomonas ponticola TaxID=2786951 RepID=UPI001CF78254